MPLVGRRSCLRRMNEEPFDRPAARQPACPTATRLYRPSTEHRTPNHLITRRFGFTLIELLVVIAIIAILAALLFPVFSVAREKARRNSCSSNLQKIAAAITLYEKDNGGYPPDLWAKGPSSPASPTNAWESGFLLLLGKSSPRVAMLVPNSTEWTFWINQPAYLANIQDLHCPDNVDTDFTDIAYTASIPSDDFYNTYEGMDGWAAQDATASGGCSSISPNPVSVRKYSLARLPADGCGGTANDYSNPDYTRQLKFTHPDTDTVVTWCTAHRRLVAGIPTPSAGAKDELVLFLDGKVAPKQYEFFSNSGPSSHPVQGNGLRSETTP